MSRNSDPPHPGNAGAPEAVPSAVTRGIVGSAEQRAADLWVLQGLGGPALAIGLIYLVLAGIQVQSGADWVIPAATFVLGALCITLGTALLRGAFEPRQVHPWAFGVGILSVLNGALHIHLTGEPQHTVELVLAIVAAGVVLLDTGWLSLLVATAFCAWLFALPEGGASGEWVHYGLTLVGAALLAWLALASRHSLFRHMAAVRREERLREVDSFGT